MGVTIYDIAERANVSIATVSRVFNGSKRVSESTKRHVLVVAGEMGYRPHADARSLARRRASVVAAVVPMLSNLFFTELLRGLQDRIGKSEYDLLVFAARTMDEVDGQLDRALQRGRAAGTLLLSTPIDEARAKRLRAGGQPVVLVDSFHDGFDSVVANNQQGGELATRHLIACGTQRIAMIMASEESVPARDRRTGFLRALEAAGWPRSNVVIDSSDDLRHHGYTEEEGYAAMKRLLSGRKVPDGVFVTSDVQAVGALHAIRDAGLRVPGDVRIVGFDDIMISRHIGLTTVRQPTYEIGSLAGEHLIARIKDPDRSHVQTVLSPKLIVRCTSADVAPEAAAREYVSL